MRLKCLLIFNKFQCKENYLHRNFVEYFWKRCSLHFFDFFKIPKREKKREKFFCVFWFFSLFFFFGKNLLMVIWHFFKNIFILLTFIYIQIFTISMKYQIQKHYFLFWLLFTKIFKINSICLIYDYQLDGIKIWYFRIILSKLFSIHFMMNFDLYNFLYFSKV